MSYLIINTWNGDDYSERSGSLRSLRSGIIETVDDLSKAREVALKEFALRYLTSPGLSRVDNNLYALGRISFTEVKEKEDTGAIHILEKCANTYGALINPHVNSVTAINKEQFDKIIDDLREDGEFMHNLKQDETSFNEWLMELGKNGNNDGYGMDYFILYKT